MSVTIYGPDMMGDHEDWKDIDPDMVYVARRDYEALETAAGEMREALEARQEADAAWKNDNTAHNVCHEMTKKAEELARTALAAFDNAKEGK